MPQKLFVEGNNDLHVIVHLLKKFRPAFPPDVKTWGGGLEICDGGSDDRALKIFGEAIKGSDGTYGIVLDADNDNKKTCSRSLEGDQC